MAEGLWNGGSRRQRFGMRKRTGMMISGGDFTAKGLYVHVPFCVRKCRYCDFVSFAGAETKKKMDKYLDALEREAERYTGMKFDTVFIGGGTPSALGAEQLRRLTGIVNSAFEIAPDAEFSMEVNPGTLDGDKTAAMLGGGVNRVSVGVQSFDDKELAALGRIHTAAQAVKAVEDIYAAGIGNINIDLMTSVPYQTAESLKKSLETAVSLPVSHISAYSLILEEGTPMYDDYRAGKIALPDDDTDRDNYDMLIDFLEQNGFRRYEISNFAKEGRECRHNIKYWECREYVGLGAAAHSYDGKRRFFNTADLDEYISGRFRAGVTELTRNDMTSEFMITGLRMTRGVDAAEFKSRFGTEIEKVYGEQLGKFTSLGLMEKGNGRYFLTRRGLDVSNGVMCEFII